MKTEAIANRLEQVKWFYSGDGMEDIKQVSDSDLKDRKVKLEKLIEKEGELVYANDGRGHKLKVKDIFLDAEGNLITEYYSELIKLSDLVNKSTGEIIFKEVFQTKEFQHSLTNLGFIKSVYNTYKRFEQRLKKIDAELDFRIYGIKPTAENEEHPDILQNHARVNLFRQSGDAFLDLVNRGKVKKNYRNPKEISKMIILQLNNSFPLTKKNERTIYDYFRQHRFFVRADKNTKEFIWVDSKAKK